MVPTPVLSTALNGTMINLHVRGYDDNVTHIHIKLLLQQLSLVSSSLACGLSPIVALPSDLGVQCSHGPFTSSPIVTQKQANCSGNSVEEHFEALDVVSMTNYCSINVHVFLCSVRTP